MLGYRAFQVLTVKGEKQLWSLYKPYRYSTGRLQAKCDPSIEMGYLNVDYELVFPQGCDDDEVPGEHGRHESGCGFYFHPIANEVTVNLKCVQAVYGLVWASGRIKEHTDGVCRASHIEVLALAGAYKPDIDIPFFYAETTGEALALLEAYAKEFEPDAITRE